MCKVSYEVPLFFGNCTLPNGGWWGSPKFTMVKYGSHKKKVGIHCSEE